MKRILICGDRAWEDAEIIERFLAKQPKDTVVIEGEAPGADTLAREAAQKLGLTVAGFKADWGGKSGHGAGPERNTRMLKEGQPTLVVGFHRNMDGRGQGRKSAGTKDMLSKAILAGVPTYLYGRDKTFQKLDIDIFNEILHPTDTPGIV
jgi:hypothetical protein